jgi:hypothetical protein
LHAHRAGDGGQALELLENEPGTGSGLLQAENASLWGAHRAAGLGSPHPGPPPRPRLPPGDFKGSALNRARSRANTTVSSFQTTGTVLPTLTASTGATAAKVLVCFFSIFLLIFEFPPWGREKKIPVSLNNPKSKPAAQFGVPDAFQIVFQVTKVKANKTKQK